MSRPMVQQQEYFLYVGRNAITAQHLHQALASVLDGDETHRAGAAHYPASGNGVYDPEGSYAPLGGAPSLAPVEENGTAPAHLLPLATISNQKAALRFVQSHATRLIAVETSDKATSRKRFCDVVRQRAPGACVVAVGAHAPAYTFAFDAVIPTPLRTDDILRVARMLKSHAPETVITRGAVTLDTVTREVVSPRGSGKMTPKECALLTLLMRRANEVVDRAEIMRTIWETSYLEDTRTLDVHVRWVRQKIEQDPEQPTLLLTRRGIGYLFVAPEDE